jgi:arginine-tRNA-protein transferase
VLGQAPILTTLREKTMRNNTFDLITSLHESESAYAKPEVNPAHEFEVSLEPDEFTEEKFQLFENYQRHVHHEKNNEISRNGFRRFLCSTPLHRHDDGGKRIGSFHQMYRLDGRLIAMSVLDLLPHAVSGVYFIYHSDYEKWSFGKLSALREAALAIEEGYNLYYMGYFIWSCKKMRYKGDYRPQNVLDYDTLEWDVMDDEMKRLMDKRKWVSMSRERNIKTALEHAEGGDEEALVEAAYSTDYAHPVAAMDSGRSILDLRVPGAMTLERLQEEVNLHGMKITLDRNTVHRMQDITSWSEGSLKDSTSIMGVMAELAACIGPTLARDIVVDLAR